jgi:amino acid transporter
VNSLKQMLKKVNWLAVAQMVVVMLLALSPLFIGSHSVFGVHEANAQLNRNFPCDPSTGLRCNETSIPQIFRTIINWALGIAFGIAVIFLIIGGFRYITAGGNEESVEKGKSSVINALIGIVIIVLSYVIVNVVANLVTGNSSVGP